MTLAKNDVYFGLKTADDGAEYTCSLLNIRGYTGLFQGYRTDAEGNRTVIATAFYRYVSSSSYDLHLSGVVCKDAEGNAIELPKSGSENADIHVYVDGAKIGVMSGTSGSYAWTPAE